MLLVVIYYCIKSTLKMSREIVKPVYVDQVIGPNLWWMGAGLKKGKGPGDRAMGSGTARYKKQEVGTSLRGKVPVNSPGCKILSFSEAAPVRKKILVHYLSTNVKS